MHVEAKLRKFIDRHDAPLDRAGGVWKLRAPVDAFAHLARLVGPEHMVLLEGVVAKVFAGAPPPKTSEERFGVSAAPFSSWLRDGIANMLLMLSVLHAEVGLDTGGEDPGAFVNRLITSLPGLSDDERVIMSLERQLPVLMEVAPDPLLSVLELLLEGDSEKIAPIFAEASNYGMPQSNLPYLLWGLETLAWDPARLPRVALLLARMAAIDPGGRLGNRPMASLRNIFLAWLPGTNAPLAARLRTIDTITAQLPEVGWTLLCQLMPKNLDSSSLTSKPRYREAGASNREALTDPLMNECYEEIIDRTFSLVGDDCARWFALIDAFPRFSTDRREQFLDMLEPWAADLSAEAKVGARAALARIANRHGRFREAKWALPDSDLKRLQAIVTSLDSHDPVEQARLLFDEWLPRGGADYAEAEHRIAEQRRRALAGLAAKGAEPILALAGKARLPRLVASAAAEVIDDDRHLIALIDEAAGGDRPLQQFAEALAGALRWRRGEDFNAKFVDIARARGWSSEQIATLMLGWPEEPSTWTLIDGLGAEASTLFWSRREPRRFDGSASDLAMMVEHFLSAERPGTVLEAIHGREDELAWSLINRLLSARVQEINRNGNTGDMDDYYVEELFKKLRTRDDIPEVELARWEYAYFPMLEHGESDLTVFALTASDPAFFVSVLSDVFIADDTNPDDRETTEEERRRAEASHRLLVHFNRAPGETEGLVEKSALDQWVEGVIDAASKAKRLNIVYIYIGQALAHSSEKDAVWPQAPVAAVIEHLASPDVERGLMIERFNMRGVYTKAMFEGGKKERDLAAQYRQWKAQLSPSYMRTSAMLEAIAKHWDADAKLADQATARDKLRFE